MKKDIKKAKKYLKSWQRLNSYGQCGRFLSPEAKQFNREKYIPNSEFANDNIFEWLIKKALNHL